MSADELGEYKAEVTPINKATLKWDKDLIFNSLTPRGYDLDFDANIEWGCMPVEALLMSLGGCMAIDVVSILEKMRQKPEGLEIEMEGERSPTPPQRYLRMKLRLLLTGEDLDEAKVRRAVDLSREKYCSVYHSLREDIVHEVEIVINGREVG